MKLTIQAIIAEVRRLATEKPNFIYQRVFREAGSSCSYTRGGNCSGCIFGQAILALSPESLPILTHIDTCTDACIDTLLARLGVETSSPQVNWCVKVQCKQDGGSTWEQAIADADECFPLLTIENLIAEVRYLASEQPEFIYQKIDGHAACKYTMGANCDGCLFGQAILRLSPKLRERLAFKDKSGVGINNLLIDLEVTRSHQQYMWCSLVQNRQDAGDTWSQAIERGDKTYPLS